MERPAARDLASSTAAMSAWSLWGGAVDADDHGAAGEVGCHVSSVARCHRPASGPDGLLLDEPTGRTARMLTGLRRPGRRCLPGGAGSGSEPGTRYVRRVILLSRERRCQTAAAAPRHHAPIRSDNLMVGQAPGDVRDDPHADTRSAGGWKRRRSRPGAVGLDPLGRGLGRSAKLCRLASLRIAATMSAGACQLDDVSPVGSRRIADTKDASSSPDEVSSRPLTEGLTDRTARQTSIPVPSCSCRSSTITSAWRSRIACGAWRADAESPTTWMSVAADNRSRSPCLTMS